MSAVYWTEITFGNERLLLQWKCKRDGETLWPWYHYKQTVRREEMREANRQWYANNPGKKPLDVVGAFYSKTFMEELKASIFKPNPAFYKLTRMRG